MATKVHDQGDEEREFAEIDRILAQAKQDRKLMRRAGRNLSDIPENFAHVPGSSPDEPPQHARPVSLDMSQPDLASRRRDLSTSRPPRPPRHHNPKLHVPGLSAPVKWLRGYMGCLVAAQHRDDHVQRSMQQQHHPPRVASYGV